MRWARFFGRKSFCVMPVLENLVLFQRFAKQSRSCSFQKDAKDWIARSRAFGVHHQCSSITPHCSRVESRHQCRCSGLHATRLRLHVASMRPSSCCSASKRRSCCKDCWQLSTEIAEGAARAALADARNAYDPHAERANWLPERQGQPGRPVRSFSLLYARLGQLSRWSICGEPPERQFALGPWLADTNHFK